MITLIGGRLGNPASLAVPNGTIELLLNVDALVIAPPYGRVMAAMPIIFQFDATGNLKPGAQIWSNFELNPRNSTELATLYYVAFYDANNGRISKVPMWWQFVEAAGATVDISTMTAYLATGD